VVAYGPSTGSMLAASADRDRAVDVLRAGFAEGRLTQAEFEARVSRVQASRTYSQLAELVGDLPIGPQAPGLTSGSPQQDPSHQDPSQRGPAQQDPPQRGPAHLTSGQPGSGQPGSGRPGSAAAEIDDRQAATPLAHLALTALVIFTLAALFTALIVYMHILGQPTSVQLTQTPGLTQLPHVHFLPQITRITPPAP
jgi:hypothetical protein